MDCSLPGSSVHGIFQARYWSGLPLPSPGDFPYTWIEPWSPALQADSLPFKPLEKPTLKILKFQNNLSMISLSSLSGLKLNNKLKSRKFEMHNLYPENKKNSKSVSPKLDLIIQMTIHKKMDK